MVPQRVSCLPCCPSTACFVVQYGTIELDLRLFPAHQTRTLCRRLLEKLLVVSLLIYIPSKASAEEFLLTYTSNDGINVSATFTGTAFENEVVDVADISLTINGIAQGAVSIFGYYGEPSYTMSFSASDTDFWFADAGVDTNVTNGSHGLALIGSSVATATALVDGNNLEWVFDAANGIPEPLYPGVSPLNASYSLAVIPEPSAIAFLFAGVCFLTVFVRRRS